MRTPNRLLVLLVFFTTTNTIKAQSIDDLEAVVSDLITLSQLYINPAAQGVSYQASAGWFTSAKKREKWNLELSVQGGALVLPNKFKTFNINQSQLQNLSILSPDQNVTLPTAIGGTDILELEGSIDGDVFRFDAPEGIDEDLLGYVNLQAAFTVWKGTTLIARLSPKIKVKKTAYNTIGLGVHHNLSQWFVKEESNFSLGALVAYSNFNIEKAFSAINVNIGVLNSVAVQGDSFTYQLTASQQIKKFSISAGLGVISSSFDYEIGGEGELVLFVLNEVLNNTSNTNSEFKVDLGLDYQLSDFSINSMLTFGRFANLTLGLNYNL
jgi:hypothetical protein